MAGQLWVMEGEYRVVVRASSEEEATEILERELNGLAVRLDPEGGSERKTVFVDETTPEPGSNAHIRW